ncbi:hypothetical protein GCM10011506_24420 [Marivirga lumbricoides]|uniref:IPT/TIG domain-containing protein n=1 Tax=Marivirga lumbricoides TaxID=1046115 RepID=A0ABQ1MF35_9BACT|nr:hypothetical protein GCM10011506_24420 [Marivirga lumbricoides]
MKKIVYLAFILSCFLPFISCLEEGIPQADSRLANVSNLFPVSGYYGDTIRLNGSQLREVDSLFLNGMSAPIFNIEDDHLNFSVPFNSLTGPVSVQNPYGISMGPDFTVLGENDSVPQLIIIDSISPNEGLPFTQVKIYGNNFGNSEDNLSVLLAGQPVQIDAVTNFEILFTVGANSTTGNVAIASEGDTIVGPVFTILTPQVLSIQSISPDSGPELTQVIVTGENFGNDLNDITVTLNGEETNLISVSNSQIVFIVPDGATTGPVVVNRISNGQKAEGPVFTVTNLPLVVTVNTLVSDGVGNPFDIIQLTNFLLIADDVGHIIRLYDLNTNQFVAAIGNGQPGFVNGQSANAQFNLPSGMALDGNNNLIIADRSNHSIRGVSGGNVSTVSGIGQEGFADGDMMQQAQYNNPVGVAIDGSMIYVADFQNHAIRRINLQTQQVSTIAGNGTPGFVNGNPNVSRLNFPAGIVLDGNGNLIIADYLNHSIRSLNLSTLELTTLAGINQAGFQDGTNQSTRFNRPIDVDVDDEGNIYVADALNHSIRMIANGETITLAGNGSSGNQNGNGSSAQFNTPVSVLAVSSSEILVGDYNNKSIRILTIE